MQRTPSAHAPWGSVSGDCFTQFRGREAEVQAARAELQDLEPAMRDFHYGVILNIEPATLKSGIGTENVFSDHSVEADSSPCPRQSVDSENFDDNSSCDEPAAKKRHSENFDDNSCDEAAAKKRHYKKRAGTASTKQRTLRFQGSLVCQFALQRLYGIGNSLAQSLRNGGCSHRTGDKRQPKHEELGCFVCRFSSFFVFICFYQELGFSLLIKSCHRWPSVLVFFWFLYHTAAEGLPEAVVSMERVADEANIDGAGSIWT